MSVLSKEDSEMSSPSKICIAATSRTWWVKYASGIMPWSTGKKNTAPKINNRKLLINRYHIKHHEPLSELYGIMYTFPQLDLIKALHCLANQPDKLNIFTPSVFINIDTLPGSARKSRIVRKRGKGYMNMIIPNCALISGTVHTYIM